MIKELSLFAFTAALLIPLSNGFSSEEKYDVEPVDFYGFDRYAIQWQESDAEVIVPKTVDADRRWVWLGFYNSKLSRVFAQEMLERGFHVVGARLRSPSWSPAQTAQKNEFYKWVTKRYNLSEKAVLAGFSQGGISSYNWAVRNPDKVAAIYGDAPVCDVKSWPCALGKSKRNEAKIARTLQTVLKFHGFKTKEELLAYKGNPVDLLEGLAKHNVPIIHVVGDKDTIVPVAENTAVIEKRYKELGGKMEIIHKPEAGHNHGLKDYTELVAFILANGQWKQ